VPRPCPYPRSSRPWPATSTPGRRRASSYRIACSKPWPQSATRGPGAGAAPVRHHPGYRGVRCAGRGEVLHSDRGVGRRPDPGGAAAARGGATSPAVGVGYAAGACNAWTMTSWTGCSAPGWPPARGHRPARADASGRGRRQERPRRPHRHRPALILREPDRARTITGHHRHRHPTAAAPIASVPGVPGAWRGFDHRQWRSAELATSIWATRDFPQDRRLARLGPGARRAALFWAAHPVSLGVAHFRSAARRAP
jgi:hypothetical protein